MTESFYTLFAKVLAFLGGIVLIGPILFYLLASGTVGYVPQPFGILILADTITLGLAMIVAAGTIQRMRGETEPFLVNSGGTIHSGRDWEKAPEPGLFETWCGLLVSTNQESGATAHVGYRIIPVKRATCNACVQRRGRAILDAGAHRRDF